MKKILLWIFIPLFLVLAAAVVLPFVFKDKIVGLIQEEANKKLNATLVFDKDVSLGLIRSFPDFTIGIKNLSLAGKGVFEGDTLISAKEINARIDVMSVLSGDKIQIKNIYLGEPRIQVRVLKDGTANYNISIPDSAVKSPEDTAAAKFHLGLKKLEIEKGYLSYDDQEYGFYTLLNQFNHQLKGDFTQDNFLLETISEIGEYTMSYGGVPYINRAKTKLEANLDMDMKNFKFTFKDNKAQLNALELGVDGYFAMPGNDMDMDLKFNCKQTDFKNILSMIPAIYQTNFEQVKASGKMGLNGHVKGIMNDTRMPAFGAVLTVSNGAFAYPSMPSDVKNVNIDMKIENPDGVPDHTLINLAALHAEIANNPIDAKVLVSTPVSDANIDATVKGKVILDELVRIIPLEKGTQLSGTITADLAFKGMLSAITNKQFEKFSAKGIFGASALKYISTSFKQGIEISSMNMDFTPAFVNLTDFHSNIGGSDLTAKGRLENFLPYIFSNQTLKGNLQLQSTYFNVNQFMTEEPKDNKQPQPKDTVPLMAFPLPANIDFAMSAVFKEMLYDNLLLKDMTGNLLLKDQKLSLENLKMGLFNGQVGMHGSYDAMNVKKPVIDMKMSLKNMDMGLLSKYCVSFKKYAPIADYIQGNFSADFTTNGVLDEHLKPQLDILTAIGNLEIPKFKISGFEPLDLLANTFNQNQYKQLVIDKVKAWFTVEKGRIHFKPFNFKLDQSLVTVQGSNGIDQTIDYTMDMMVPRSQLGKADAEVNNLMNEAAIKGVKINIVEKIPVKVLIGGTIKKPTIKIDLKDAKKSLVDDLKNQLKNTVDAKKQELEKKAKDEANQLKQQAEQKAKAEADKAKQQAQQEADRLKKEAEAKAKAEADKAKQKGKEKLKEGMDNIFKKK